MLNTLGTLLALQEEKDDIPQGNNHNDTPQETQAPVLIRQSHSDLQLSNISSKSSNKNKSNNHMKSKSSNRISLSQLSHDLSESLSPKPINKICIGDKIRITTVNRKTKKQLTNVKGVVMYIAYPYIGHGIRYGINLDKAIGEHNGSIYFDVQTGKPAKKSRIKQYVNAKSMHKRKFFKAKKKHGIFVKKHEITCIDRESTLATRFTINDKVEVRYKGDGYIKFIGNLQHKKDMGVWYGIELIERRGQHNGIVNNVKYFQCQSQYGLLCRQSHLTLINHPIRDSALKVTVSLEEDDEKKSNTRKRRPLTKAKPQTSQKIWKLLGDDKIPKSAANLWPPRKNPSMAKNSSESSEDSFISSSLVQLDQRVQNTSQDLAQMLATQKRLHDQFKPAFAHNLSPNILPGMKNNKSKPKLVEEYRSFRRGETTYILPDYHNKFKEKLFCDYFSLNEFEDELGEGEFGVVYKCRKMDGKEDEPSMSSFQTEFHTERSSTQFDGVSDSDSCDFPGDHSSDLVSYSGSEEEKKDEILYAVKKIKKAKFHHLAYTDQQNAIKLLRQEIKLLEKVQRLKQIKLEGSEYVIDLVDVFEDRNYLYIVTNFCSGGNLWQYIEEKEEVYSEEKIQVIMRQILEGLVFLHSNDMAHLDIKPDNIMLNENNEIQLIDFGMSKVIPPLTKAGILVGTPNFVAPEVIEGFYDIKADIWSVGVILFMLRFGYPPFHEISGADSLGDHKGLFERIKQGFNPIVKSGLGAWFPSEDPVSDELKDLLCKMLDRDLANRATAKECLAHSYFKTVANNKKLPPTIMDAFTKFSGQCRFRVMIARLFAHQIEPQQMKQLTAIWDKFDLDKDGSLTLDQFKKVMSEYEHGYKEYQIEAIFESLDWNETDTINFNSLLTAFSYQRLVAVDERLWEAFSALDIDDDGHITKAEIKRILSKVNPEALNNTLRIQPSVFISDCINDVDWDDDGQVDYEEFLRALHPTFNEGNVTPRAFQTPSLSQQINREYVFQPSIQTGHATKNNDKVTIDTYHKYKNKISDQ